MALSIHYEPAWYFKVLTNASGKTSNLLWWMPDGRQLREVALQQGSPGQKSECS